jgi:uncharacterized membrane protein
MNIKKSLTYFAGQFQGMTKPEKIDRIGKPATSRSLVTITTEDQQIAYFEVRSAIIGRIKKLKLKGGDKVEIGFVFIGSEKEGRTYNNLFINAIDYAS